MQRELRVVTDCGAASRGMNFRATVVAVHLEVQALWRGVSPLLSAPANGSDFRQEGVERFRIRSYFLFCPMRKLWQWQFTRHW
jgi:hypothetical protein